MSGEKRIPLVKSNRRATETGTSLETVDAETSAIGHSLACGKTLVGLL